MAIHRGAAQSGLGIALVLVSVGTTGVHRKKSLVGVGGAWSQHLKDAKRRVCSFPSGKQIAKQFLLIYCIMSYY